MKILFQKFYSVPVLGVLSFESGDLLFFIQIIIGICTIIKLGIDIKKQLKNK